MGLRQGYNALLFILKSTFKDPEQYTSYKGTMGDRLEIGQVESFKYLRTYLDGI